MPRKRKTPPPGALAHVVENGTPAGASIIDQLVEGEVRLQLQFFDQTGDAAHLWRAWREARSLGAISPACLAMLVPRLDRLAAEEHNDTRARQREARNYLLLGYYHELTRMQEGRPGCAQTIAEVYRKTAKLAGTTPGAVKQAVLVFEGRGQRGQRNR